MLSNLERGQSITIGGLNVAYGYGNLMSPSATLPSTAQPNTFRLTPSKKQVWRSCLMAFYLRKDVQGDPAQRPTAQYLFFYYQIFEYPFICQRLL